MDILTYRKAHGLSQAGFANAITATTDQSATQSLVSQWENGAVRIPAERCSAIETATGGEVTRHDLRPDLFPSPPTPRKAS